METDKLEQIKILLKSLIDLVAELEAELKKPPQIVDPETQSDGTTALDWELWWPETWGRNLANGE